MRLVTISIAGVLLSLVAGCLEPVPLYCDEDKPCADPARPYCDLSGQYGPDKLANSCVPNPFDAGMEHDAMPVDPDAAGPERIVEVALGEAHSCARTNRGRVRCWGRAAQLGYVTSENIGDDELPMEGQDVDLPEPAVQLAAGYVSTCALTTSSRVICWGANPTGALGLPAGDTNSPPRTFLDLGSEVVSISGGTAYCAKLVNGGVRCWGGNSNGTVGIASSEPIIGDDEALAEVALLDLPAPAVRISGGAFHLCAALEGGRVSCWGRGDHGVLGYGNLETIGDDETPRDAGFVDVGLDVAQVDGWSYQTCARSSTGLVRCWGKSGPGLGHGVLSGGEAFGDVPGEMPPPTVELGAPAMDIAVGGAVTCAVLEDGNAKCWGAAAYLGAAISEDIGDDEPVVNGPLVSLGVRAVDVEVGSGHFCAVTEAGGVRCWGNTFQGRVGYGVEFEENTYIGDDEVPSGFGDVQVFPDLAE